MNVFYSYAGASVLALHVLMPDLNSTADPYKGKNKKRKFQIRKCLMLEVIENPCGGNALIDQN